MCTSPLNTLVKGFQSVTDPSEDQKNQRFEREKKCKVSICVSNVGVEKEGRTWGWSPGGEAGGQHSQPFKVKPPKAGVHSTVQSLNCSDSLTFLPIKVPKIATMTMLISIIQDDTFTALCHMPCAIPRASRVSAHSIFMSTYYFPCFKGVETEATRGIASGQDLNPGQPG